MKILRSAPFLILGAVFICYTVCSLFMPPLGDDLAHSFRLIDQNDCWYAIPRSFYRQWLFGNARTADMFLPLFLNYLPSWALALVNGTFTAAWFYIIARLCAGSLRNYATATAVMFILMFSMRWDGLWMEFNTQCNYIWSSAAALAFLGARGVGRGARYYLLGAWSEGRGAKSPHPPKGPQPHKSPSYLVPRSSLLIFCFIAGASHEACGFPLAAGLAAYFAVGGMKERPRAERAYAIALMAGGLFSLTSPASLNRVGAVLQPEPWHEIILFSGTFVLMLLIATISVFFIDRRLFRRLLHSPWLIFAIASVVSCGFMLLSRFGGRPGWFAQIFAIIALFLMFREIKRTPLPQPVKALATTLMALATIAECGATGYWQIRLGSETETILEKYAASPDGVVFANYTPDTKVPFFVRGRVHGVPDPDDTYYLYRIAQYIGEGKPLIVLPEGTALPQPPFEPVQLADGSILAGDTLAGRYTDAIVEAFPRIMIRRGDKEYIETGFSHSGSDYLLYSPVDRDRGEK